MKSRMTLMGAMLSLLLTFGLTQTAQAYIHPGLPLTIADLDQLKTNITKEPWKSAYAGLAASTSTNYVMQGPFGSVGVNQNDNQWMSDMGEVWSLSRMWYFTKDNNYAQKAHDILLAYANTQTNFTGVFFLSLGDYTYRVFGGADILRGTWPGWTAADTTACSNYFKNVWEPNYRAPTPLFAANQGIELLIFSLALGVFDDDTNYVNSCLQAFRQDAVGALPNSLPNGELGDSGRDQGHAYGELLHLTWCAEVLWKQGIDVYSDLDNRLLAAGEYYGRYNIGTNTPFIPFGTGYGYYWFNGGSPNSSVQPPDMLNMIQGAYGVRKGMSTPYIGQYRDTLPETGDSFMWRKTSDTSTATPLAAVSHPATASVTSLTDINIGGPSPTGSASYSGGTWTIKGGYNGGDPTYCSGDTINFAYIPVTGDCTIIAKVTSLPNTGSSAIAGVMIRDSLSGVANKSLMGIVPSIMKYHSFMCGETDSTHGWVGQESSVPGIPYWVKLERVGNRITPYLSSDGASWGATVLGDFTMSGTVYVGLFVSSGTTGTACTATFTDVRITGGDGLEAPKVPASPFAVYGSPGIQQVPLRWLESFGATSYKVKRATVSGGPYTTIASGLTNSSYINTNLPNGATYYFVVSAVNSAGESTNSPEDVVTTQYVPPPPVLTAAPGDGYVGLSWNVTPGLSAANTYNVRRATVSGGPYTIITNVSVNSFVDTAVVNGTAYYYVVSGINTLGEGTNSAEAVATPAVRTVISINLRGGSSYNGNPATMAASENAGWIIANNWNNAAGASGTLSSLAQSDGTATAASVIWSGNNTYSMPITESPGDYRMMKGYVEATSTSTNTVTVSGLPSAYTSGGYNVYVYCDGDNGSSTRTSYYSIGSITNIATDYKGVNFYGTYLPADNSSGNYVLFSHQTGGSFTLLAWGSGHAVINGIQIVSMTIAPPAPKGLQATPISSSQINLSWTASSGATSYNVKRSTTGGGPYTTLASPTTTNYTDTAVLNGVVYYYVVSFMNSSGESANSTEVSAIPAGKVNGTIIGTAGSYNNSGNTIDKVFDGNLTTYFDAAAATGAWAGLDFGSGVSNRITQIKYCPRVNYPQRMPGGIFQGATDANFTTPVNLFTITAQPSQSVMTVQAITNTTPFEYVRYLGPANGDCNVAEVEFDGYVPQAPAAPTGLSATPGDSQVGLNWLAASSATSYNLKRLTTNGGTYTVIASNLTLLAYTDTGLVNGTNYYYVVSALNAGVESTNSIQVSAMPNVVPVVPTSLAATAGDGYVSLSWLNSPGAANYFIKRSLVSGGPYNAMATNGVSVTFTNTGLSNGTYYYFVVSAWNSAGGSVDSAEASALPLSQTPAQLNFVLAGNQLQLSWPVDHTGWLLQAQTNSVGTGLGTNWVTVTGTDATNQMSIPLDPANGSVFFRLSYP